MKINSTFLGRRQLIDQGFPITFHWVQNVHSALHFGLATVASFQIS
jgi:hypothetical protein